MACFQTILLLYELILEIICKSRIYFCRLLLQEQTDTNPSYSPDTGSSKTPIAFFPQPHRRPILHRLSASIDEAWFRVALRSHSEKPHGRLGSTKWKSMGASADEQGLCDFYMKQTKDGGCTLLTDRTLLTQSVLDQYNPPGSSYNKNATDTNFVSSSLSLLSPGRLSCPESVTSSDRIFNFSNLEKSLGATKRPSLMEEREEKGDRKQKFASRLGKEEKKFSLPEEHQPLKLPGSREKHTDYQNR